jgi:hypothetical protein
MYILLGPRILLDSKRLDGCVDPVTELVERPNTVRGDPRETTRCGSAVCGAFHGFQHGPVYRPSRLIGLDGWAK